MGQVERKVDAPGANCLTGQIFNPPRIATFSLDLSLPAGTYSILIDTASFLTELPYRPHAADGSEFPEGLPAPEASRTIEIL
ncbi:hypothetical protein D3C86_1374360 [compost metagenome]